MDYTTTELISGVKRRASVPTNQNLFQNNDFVKFLSAEMLNTVVPKIIAAQEDYFITYKDFTITQGVSSYSIPTRAMGNKLKEVAILDPSGNFMANVPRLSYSDLTIPYRGDIMRLTGAYIQGADLVLHPADQLVGNTLRMYYLRRPNQLVTTEDCGQITSLNTGTGEVTLNNVPTTWAVGDTVDFIKNTPPFKSLGDDYAITNVSGFVLTFSSVPSDLSVGDYVGLSGESPIPQIPYEGFALLEQAGAIKCAEALGKTSQLQAHQQKYQLLEKDFVNFITPRIDEEPQKVVSRKGIFRSARAYTWPR